MHRNQIMPVALGALMLMGCATRLKTATTFDDTVDFSAYRTFAQAPPPQAIEGMPGYSEITGHRVQERIAYDLEQKGLQPASWDEADLQVSFMLGGQERQDTEYWGGWGWYGPGEVTTENYVQGSLVIDMADRVKQRLVWHGYGTRDVFSQPKNDDALMQAVDEILQKFPPSTGEPPEAPKVKADDVRREEGAQ
ncbi:MAG: DUF4136 domain-containing protein [Myxococcales bacterium]